MRERGNIRLWNDGKRRKSGESASIECRGVAVSPMTPDHAVSRHPAAFSILDFQKVLKYVNTSVVFQEIPDEVTLAVNISNCPCRCPGCHSKYLWRDVGEPLTPSVLDRLIAGYGPDITCVGLMGGDAEPVYVNSLARHLRHAHPGLKVAWYSGRARVPSAVNREDFDYIKVGPYIEHLGCLRSRTTNQRLYKRVSSGGFEDITGRFWEK